MAIILRAAQQDDERLIRDLIRRVHINPTGLDWRRFTLAVDEQGRMVGCAQMKPHGDGSRELASLAVEEDQRGRGVARLLIDTLLSREHPPVYLMCRAELVPLYEKFGFRLVDATARPPFYRRMWRILEVVRFIFRSFDGPRLMVWKERTQ